jgi:hypothetical protein
VVHTTLHSTARKLHTQTYWYEVEEWCLLGCCAVWLLLRTDVSEELSASIIRVTRIGELGTMLVTASVFPSSPILVTLMMYALSTSETSVLTRAIQRNIPEDTILHSHRCENLKSYILV